MFSEYENHCIQIVSNASVQRFLSTNLSDDESSNQDRVIQRVSSTLDCL